METPAVPASCAAPPAEPGARLLDGERLAALRDTVPLDAAPKAALERLTRLAVRLLGVPVSLVSFVTEDREIVQSAAGLPEPWSSTCEIPLSRSFSRLVVEQDAPLAIEDAREDPLVSGHPAIEELGVVAYAGVPLRLRDGRALGAVCATESAPRAWTPDDLEVLGDLAALAADAIEPRRRPPGRELRDGLTGLPDRTLFGELVAAAGERAARAGDRVAVLALGLDRFRLVNEAFGHAAGDAVLVTVARRLQEAVRGGDAVCRVAGDEFLVLCEGVRDERDALVLAERLRGAISEPTMIDGEPQAIGATVGLATAKLRVDPDELVDAALVALGRAKRGSRRVTERVDPARRAKAAARLRLRNAIPGAHERGELDLAYQPIVGLANGRVSSVEALLRWQHPELGPVAPAAFVPAAEDSGAIVGIGAWVLERACADLAAWRRAAGARHLRVSVNVAPVQLRTPGFLDVVQDALGAAGLEPGALTLEVTERAILDDRVTHRRTIEDLRALGVRLALDDFGTGYSALGYLTRFPIDTLKIDRLFVAGLKDDARAGTVVQAVIGLARGLGLRTVAEGVEKEEQRRRLSALGCELGQGHLFSKPVPAGAVAPLLRR
jgi:diguanylate cyclase (GGDEF)-like protein